MIENILLLALSSSALSFLIGAEVITESFRAWTVKTFARGRFYLIADLFDCPYCLHWWISAAVMMIFFKFNIVMYLSAQAVGYILINEIKKKWQN